MDLLKFFEKKPKAEQTYLRETFAKLKVNPTTELVNQFFEQIICKIEKLEKQKSDRV